ncbi:putative ABC transporter, P-loop containing nucleoside triphosphate hydrolase [Helianthus annuus]|nr:putative ABC transporter, P-loop containing nucleoside triphosphate hydrolase [Helianthus annuus]
MNFFLPDRTSRGLDFEGYYYWISIGALFGFVLLFNIGFILALSYLKAPGTRAIISKEKISQVNGGEGSKHQSHNNEITKNSNTNVSKPYEGKMVLPFEPLTITFQDLQYYVEPPLEMREHGFTGKRLQLLRDITGAFRPGVLTALMGYWRGSKVQDTFARISGYCEKTDIHSPQITVEESVIFSAWLRLHPDIDSKTKYKFVEEILETVELNAIKDSLVGIPGVSGLSTEQCKRLTIAVEVVANPSIIFMDEPTTGLDARPAAIVMRAVKNIVDTGRTIVFDPNEKWWTYDLLWGTTHVESLNTLRLSISGVPKIRDNYNPATWMLEVTSASIEAKLGVDFGQIYSTSTLYELCLCMELIGILYGCNVTLVYMSAICLILDRPHRC